MTTLLNTEDKKLKKVALHYTIAYFIGILVITGLCNRIDIFSIPDNLTLRIFIGTSVLLHYTIRLLIIYNYLYPVRPSMFQTATVRSVNLINYRTIQNIKRLISFTSIGLTSIIIVLDIHNISIDYPLLIVGAYFTLNTLVAYWRLYKEYKFLLNINIVSLSIVENQDVEVVTL